MIASVVISSNDTTRNSTDECMWCLREELVGSLIAASTGIILILSLITNLFICIYTLSHPKSLKKSSTVFLFNLAFVNLLITILFMPFMVVASAAEEWIMGHSDEERTIFCQITAYNFAYTVGISVQTLAAISFDRCLMFVKPYHHKKYMTWKVATGIIIFIWTHVILLYITPFFDFGEYSWSGTAGACLPIWVGNRNYVIYVTLLSTIPFTIIIVTTTWTYIFTRNFLKNDYEQREATLNNKKDRIYEKSVYSIRVRNLTGIFGMLLLFNVISFSPYITARIIGLVVGLENIPPAVYAAALILFLLNNVTNSVIQSYFRRDLHDAITKYFRMVTYTIRIRKPCKGKHADMTKDDDHDDKWSVIESTNHSTTQTQGHKNVLPEVVKVSMESQTIMPLATEVDATNNEISLSQRIMERDSHTGVGMCP